MSNKVEITAVITVTYVADLDNYDGLTAPADIFAADFDTDPAATLLDADTNVVRVVGSRVTG